MKLYAISVQWGAGLHYFRAYFDTEEAARLQAPHIHNLSKSRSKRAPKHTTRIWKLLDEVHQTPQGR